MTLRVGILTKHGFPLSRDYFLEMERRLKERGVSDENIALLRAVHDEFLGELDAYAATIKQEESKA